MKNSGPLLRILTLVPLTVTYGNVLINNRVPHGQSLDCCKPPQDASPSDFHKQGGPKLELEDVFFHISARVLIS